MIGRAVQAKKVRYAVVGLGHIGRRGLANR